MGIDTTNPAVTHPDIAPIQRCTLRLLFTTQIIGGIGVTIGISVGALLARDIAGTAVSGLAQSSATVGGALLAVPVTRIMSRSGRRPGLMLAYLAGALGGVLVVAGAITRSIPLLFVGMFLFGGGSTANLQARYAAVDLAEPAHRGRQLSLIVWATTIGAVAAPNFASVADQAMRGFGLPPLAGPFAFSTVAFLLTVGLLSTLLRPDPLLTARRIASVVTPKQPAEVPESAAQPPADASGRPASETGMLAAARVVWRHQNARLGVTAVAVGHLVMVAVMVMTPVRLGESHGKADVLQVVGIVLSLHIAGMYALSPVFGWMTDRYGRRPVILSGVGLLLAACTVAGTAGHHTPRLTVGLVLLGLGWSATMVAGSTLLSESVSTRIRPAAQGFSDLVMGLAGASAGALSGFVVEYSGYPMLNLLAALAVIPLLALALRPVSAGTGFDEGK